MPTPDRLFALAALWSAGISAQSFDAVIDLGELSPQQGIAIDGPAPGHVLGTSMAGWGDFNGDGATDLLLTAPGADVGSQVNAGEVIVVFGGKGTLGEPFDLNALRPANGGDGSLGFILQGENGFDATGTSADFVGDINGDGLDDILLGAPGMQVVMGGFQANEGGGYIVFGRPDSNPLPGEFLLNTLRGDDQDETNTGFGVVLLGAQIQNRAGFRVAAAGDVNADGRSDFLLGNSSGICFVCPEFSNSYLLFGRPASDPWPAVFPLVSIQANLGDGSEGIVVVGSARENGFGKSLAGVGDFTGDGIGDLLFGMQNEAMPSMDAGGGFLLPGRISSPTEGWMNGVDLSRGSVRDQNLRFSAPFEGDFVGISVGGIGDVNADGAPDIALGGEFSQIGGERSGIVYVVYGETDGQVGNSFPLGQLLPGNGGNGTRGFVIAGAQGVELGTSIARLGDFNGDGIDDFAVGASEITRGGVPVGGAYVIYGRSSSDPFPAQISVDELNGNGPSRGFVLRGDGNDDQTGNWLAPGGDVNGDGSTDLLIGAPFADNNGSSAGRVYVVYGQGNNAEPPAGFRGQDTRAWFDPDRSGEGVLTEFGTLNDAPSFFAAWYTYLDGEQFWLVTDLTAFEAGDDSLTANLFRTSGGQFGQAFDPGLVETTPWGTVEVELSNCEQLVWQYRSTDGSLSGTLTLQPLLPDPTVCGAAAKTLEFGSGLGRELAGTWWNPDRAGEGIVIDLQTGGSQPNAFFSWFTYFEGQQLWVVGNTTIDVNALEIANIPLLVTRGTGFGNAFDPAQVVIEDWGTATLRFDGCNAAELSFQRSFPSGQSEAGSISLQRFTEGLLDFHCVD